MYICRFSVVWCPHTPSTLSMLDLPGGMHLNQRRYAPCLEIVGEPVGAPVNDQAASRISRPATLVSFFACTAFIRRNASTRGTAHFTMLKTFHLGVYGIGRPWALVTLTSSSFSPRCAAIARETFFNFAALNCVRDGSTE